MPKSMFITPKPLANQFYEMVNVGVHAIHALRNESHIGHRVTLHLMTVQCAVTSLLCLIEEKQSLVPTPDYANIHAYLMRAFTAAGIDLNDLEQQEADRRGLNEVAVRHIVLCECFRALRDYAVAWSTWLPVTEATDTAMSHSAIPVI